jgi:hypothetical protein
MKKLVYALFFSLAQLLASQTSDGEVSFNYIYDMYPTVYLPESCHQVTKISYLGDSLELEDGSVWKVSFYDTSKVLSLFQNDVVMITQNNDWFSSYRYRIIHQRTGMTLYVNLSAAPYENGPYTRHVVELDLFHDLVLLRDSAGNVTRYQIALGDTEKFKKWLNNDVVILGHNSGWASDYDCLLINVCLDQHVRARQY